MKDSRQKRAEEIALAVTEIPPAQREEFLCAACGVDVTLRTEVDALLDERATRVVRRTPGLHRADDEGPRSALLARSAAFWDPSRATREERPATGTLLADRYELRAPLGRGGFGEVWMAWDTKLRGYVAIKLLHSSHPGADDLAETVLAEARSAFPIKHENVVRVMNAGHSGGFAYIVMQLGGDAAPRPGKRAEDRYWIDVGASLDSVALRNGQPAFAPYESAYLLVAICAGVQAAHSLGVLHCDLKPANIVITPGGKPLVNDFGLSRSHWAPISFGTPEPDRTITLDRQEGGPYGTPQFMPPEQALGRDATPASDVWGLGAILYFLLSGRPPYLYSGRYSAHPAWDIVEQARRDEPIPLLHIRPQTPRALVDICERAMRKQPKERHPSVADLRAALLAWLGAPARTARRPNEIPAARLLRPTGILVGVLVVLNLMPLAGPVLMVSRGWTDLEQTITILGQVVYKLVLVVGAFWLANVAARSHERLSDAQRRRRVDLCLSGLLVLTMCFGRVEPPKLGEAAGEPAAQRTPKMKTP